MLWISLLILHNKFDYNFNEMFRFITFQMMNVKFWWSIAQHKSNWSIVWACSLYSSLVCCELKTNWFVTNDHAKISDALTIAYICTNTTKNVSAIVYLSLWPKHRFIFCAKQFQVYLTFDYKSNFISIGNLSAHCSIWFSKSRGNQDLTKCHSSSLNNWNGIMFCLF